MKTKIALLLSLLTFGPASPAYAAKKLRVVATLPELADITRRVGGELVDVHGLAKGGEDIHQVMLRPSFVAKLNRADALVYMGLTLEHSFLPALLSVAANPKIRADIVKGCVGPACVDCSEGLNVLQKSSNLSRVEGDQHPQGNPHYNLEPSQGVLIARNVAAGLARIDPENAARYRTNLKEYLEELEPKVSQWREWVKPLAGVKAVSYHQDVAYLARFTGLDFVDTIELKPGIAPTPTHLAALVKKMKEQGVALIVREQHFDAKTCAWLAEQTGAKVAVIGIMANAFPETETFIKMSEHNVKALLLK